MCDLLKVVYIYLSLNNPGSNKLVKIIVRVIARINV